MQIGLISDTHGLLREQVFDAFESVDVILHAGDVGDTDILVQLATLAPVHAVHGNTDDFDIRAVAPAERLIELDGCRIQLVHGHLLGSPTPALLRSAYPHCDAIIYGHTHRALVDETQRPHVINPGAAGPARFKLKPSVALLELPDLNVRIVPL